MKGIIYCNILLILLHLSCSVLPSWNLNASIELLNKSEQSKTYEMWNREMYEVNIIFKKIFTREREEGPINLTNNMLIKDSKTQGIILESNVTWNDIESFYKIKDKIYICPRGKDHIYVHDKEKNELKELIPDGFPENGDWDLKCYYQYNISTMFISYINKYPDIYALKIEDSGYKWQNISYFNDGLFDYHWTTETYSYPMKSLVLKGNFITLKGLRFMFENGEIKIEEIEGKKEIIKASTNTKAYFTLGNELDYFYFITYDDLSNFKSGYHKKDSIDILNIPDITYQINEKSDLEFLNDVELQSMKFILSNQYVYYKIKDKVNNDIYHGILDIESNKVIFNTKDKIIDFIPFNESSICAITEDSVYEICAIQDNNNQCVKSCLEGNVVIYDISKPNKCGAETTKCDDFVLKPNKICIKECNESYFAKNDQECGLCRDLYPDKPYKIMDSNFCINNIPKGAKVFNENLKLLKCEKGVNKTSEACNVCHEKCKTCSLFSEDDNNQYCTACNDENELLQEGNCVKQCSEGYYQNGKKCEKCNDDCKTCTEQPDKCTSCKEKYYLDSNTCKKCLDTCKTCENSPEHCTSCDEGFELQEDYSCRRLCDPPCKTCQESKDKCTKCDDHYYLVDYTCYNCSDSCKTCEDGPNKCTSCYENYKVDPITNECVLNCSTNCKTCEDTPNKCTSCNDGYSLNNNTNVCDLICSDSCKTCEGTATNCTSCHDGYKLDTETNECILECSKECKTCVGIAGNCTSCYNGLFLNQNTCEKCASPCQQCQETATKCTSCYDHYIFNNNTNECILECSGNCLTCEGEFDKCTSCKEHFFLKETKCEQCSDSCETCEGESAKCTSCYNGTYLVETENKCTEKCPDDTEVDEVNRKCIKKEKKEDKQIFTTTFIIIASSLILLIIIIIAFIICKKCCKRTTSDDIEETKGISEGTQEKSIII